MTPSTACYHYNNQGKPLFFLPANGFSSLCYTPLFSLLAKEYAVSSMIFRPLWKPMPGYEGMKSWHVFANDCRDALKEMPDSGVVGVGHSIGGTILLYEALRQPKRFSRLILIEPALFSKRICFTVEIARLFGLVKYIHPLIKASKNRRVQFDSIEEVIDRYRQKSAFKLISDTNLEWLAKGLVKADTVSGYQLQFNREWECRIYETFCTLESTIWTRLSTLKIPITLIKAEHTNTFFKSAISRFSVVKNLATTHEVPNSTHFLPFERPERCVELIG